MLGRSCLGPRFYFVLEDGNCVLLGGGFFIVGVFVYLSGHGISNGLNEVFHSLRL